MNTESPHLTPLLNRAFQLPADGTFQFAPLGEYPIVDPVTKNRVVQVVDAESVRAMAADIAAQKAKPNWPGLLVDRDHFSYDAGKESRAAGWANDAFDRGADGLFGPIRFTNSGKADVEGGDFRFLSPVFDRRSAVPLGGNRYRVMKLLGLALTNTPNIRNIQALTNRAEEFHGHPATIENENKGTIMPKERLIAILSLAATATDDQIVEAVGALKNRASTLDALQGEHTALKNRHATLLGASVERVLDEHKAVITEPAREAWKNRLTADFDGTVALLNGLKPAAAPAARIDEALEKYKGVITAESRDAWKNRLAADYDGTVELLKGIKPAAEKRTPLHGTDKGRGAAGVVTTTEEDPFLNRVAEVMAADTKLSETEAIVLVAGREPSLYEGYRNRLAGDDE